MGGAAPTSGSSAGPVAARTADARNAKRGGPPYDDDVDERLATWTSARDRARRSRRRQRLVVKVGSSSLASPAGGLDGDASTRWSTRSAARLAGGAQVVLVSSGAIAAGLKPLGLTRRPRDLATQQAAASVGQGLLRRALHRVVRPATAAPSGRCC